MLPKVAKRAATFPDRLTFHVLFSVTRMKIHNGKSFGILFYARKLECMKIMLNVYIHRYPQKPYKVNIPYIIDENLSQGMQIITNISSTICSYYKRTSKYGHNRVITFRKNHKQATRINIVSKLRLKYKNYE